MTDVGEKNSRIHTHTHTAAAQKRKRCRRKATE